MYTVIATDYMVLAWQQILTHTMDVLNSLANKPIAIIQQDGIVEYYGVFLDALVGEKYLSCLLDAICWQSDHVVIFGKNIYTKRQVAWYGDEPFSYTYSNTTKSALYWTKELLVLKAMVERATNETFNSCLLNLYHAGSEGMGWHSDNEKALQRNAAIASLSLGAERKFCFKHKRSKQTVALVLQHGSLLIMKGETQSNWLHRLPTTTRVQTARVNLTFRTMAT